MPQLADTKIGYYIRLTRIKEWWEKLIHLAGSAFLLWTYADQTKIDAIDFSVYVTAVFCLLLGISLSQYPCFQLKAREQFQQI